MANILLINYVYYEGCTTAMVTPYLLVIYMCGDVVWAGRQGTNVNVVSSLIRKIYK